jgi:hypothetical protein
VKVTFCSAPCGSGKTYQLIEAACRIAHQGDIVAVLQPTKELIDKTIADQLLRRFNPPAHRAFYGASPAHSVASELAEYLKTPMDGGHIVFATHQVMPFVRFWANQSRLQVFSDEELQVVKHGSFHIPNTHELITNHIELDANDAVYGKAVINGRSELEKIAKNPAKDEIYDRFRETAQILVNPHRDSFVNTKQFEKLPAGKVQQLSIHSILKPDILDGFASVTIASANFQDTLLYRIWGHQGVRFEEDKVLSQKLRFQEHKNGHRISIKYLTDRPWSRKLQGTPCQSSGDISESF